MLTFKLPFPPSVNCLYSGNHRRFKSKRYKDWICDAQEAFRAQQITHQKITGAIEVLYRLNSPDNRNRDIANSEKALSDFLVAQGVIEDDSKIQRLVMEWADDLAPGIVEVIIRKWELAD